MKNNKKYEETSEEVFIKNSARRKKGVEKKQQSKFNSVAKGFGIAGIVIASLIAVILAVVLGAYVYYETLSEELEPASEDDNNTYVDASGNTMDRELKDKGSTTKKYYTFLATATDKAGSLTDVIMIASLTYSDTDPKVSILQIPRDTYVKISANKLHFTADGELSEANFSGSTATNAIKINEVYYRGKNLAYNSISNLLSDVEGKTDAEIEAICSDYKYKFLHVDVSKVKKYVKGDNTVRKEQENNIRRDFGIFYLEQLIFYNFRIPIDYYAQVNINGFKGIVDAIGGVDLTVPQRMYYVDKYQDLYIDLYPGYQHLDGEKAEQFVRFRLYVGGDVDRLDAQKIFMDAFLDKLLSPETVTKISPIMEQIEKNLYTSISFDNLLRLSKKVLNMDLSTDVKMHTIPGAGQYINGVSYYLLDKQDTVELINKEFNVFNNAILEDDMLMVDHGDIYVPASTDTPQIPQPIVTEPEDETSESSDDEITEGNDESAIDSEEENADGSAESNEPESTDEPAEGSESEDTNNHEDEDTEDSAEGDDGSDANEPAEGDEGSDANEPAEGDEGSNVNEPAEGDEGSDANVPAEGDEGKDTDEPAGDDESENSNETTENHETELTDKPSEGEDGADIPTEDEGTVSPAETPDSGNNQTTDVPEQNTEEGNPDEDQENVNTEPEQIPSEENTPESSDESTIENDENYALLEQM